MKILMCKPNSFDALTYVINPWMTKKKLNEKKALEQWSQLLHIYKNLGIHVEIINQQKGSPDMVFAADQGIVQGNKILLSRFWYKERKQESIYYERWFYENGYTIQHLPKNVYFEGNGDSYIWRDLLFVGIGYRANEDSCTALSKLLNRKVIPLEITDPHFYHLDIGFFPLNKDTAFYYPPAFSKRSKDALKKLVPNLIEFTKDEAYGFSANSVATEHHVIHQKDNPTFRQKLTNLEPISKPPTYLLN